jgi:hypothetical protein
MLVWPLSTTKMCRTAFKGYVPLAAAGELRGILGANGDAERSAFDSL